MTVPWTRPHNFHSGEQRFSFLLSIKLKRNHHVIGIVGWSENLVSADAHFLPANRVTLEGFFPTFVTWDWMFNL